MFMQKFAIHSLEDPYDGFDVMDWTRPSLRRKSKRTLSEPLLKAEDSYFEHAIKTAMSKERLRKSEKRRQRDEQRMQGLLGKCINPDDTRVKYSQGMTLDDVAEELRKFLVGSEQR
jgi:hypothetical protein